MEFAAIIAMPASGAITVAKIPVINPIFKVTKRVTEKIINCSFPIKKIFLIVSGAASLYPVKTRIAINAGNGIRCNSKLKSTIKRIRKKA